MGRRKKEAVNVVSDERITWLKSQLAGCVQDRTWARARGNAQAVAAFRRQEQSLRTELDIELARRASLNTGPDPANRTPEEVMAQEVAHAADLAEIHLQVYVVRWLQLHPGVHLATEDGPIAICG
jgi:hypothetical protein